MQKQKNSKKSYIMFTASMVIVGTVGVFRRMIPLSSAFLAFSRGLIGAAVLAVLLIVRKKSLHEKLPRQKLCLLMLNGVALGINWMLLFEAFNYTTVATATLCYYLQPTIVLLLSPGVFRERLTAKKLVCACAALVGMAFVSGVGSNDGLYGTELKGILLAVGAACFYAVVVMLGKKIDGIDAYRKTMVQLFFAAITMVPYLLLTENFSQFSVDPKVFALVLLVGVVHTGLVYALYFGSMAGLRAQSISILSYIDPVVALFASALLLHEALSTQSIIGAVLIIASALFSEIDFPHRDSKNLMVK